MSTEWSAPSREPLPLILIRGFGGLSVEDEKRIAYQGFNDGTVYPRKRGENYIYEGMILRFMKSSWKYQDATNIVGYFPNRFWRFWYNEFTRGQYIYILTYIAGIFFFAYFWMQQW